MDDVLRPNGLRLFDGKTDLKLPKVFADNIGWGKLVVHHGSACPFFALLIAPIQPVQIFSPSGRRMLGET